MTLEKPQLKYAVAKTNSRAKDYNDNFNKILDYVSAGVDAIADKADKSDVEAINTSLANLLPIGQPMLSLSGILPNNCIWLEGAEVSRTTYASLFDVYGVSYGNGNGSTTFNLPNFIGRSIWGATERGYVGGAIPNVKGTFMALDRHAYHNNSHLSGSFYTAQADVTTHNIGNGGTVGYFDILGFAASNSSNLYKDNINYMQPTAIKIRVYTRYK